MKLIKIDYAMNNRLSNGIKISMTEVPGPYVFSINNYCFDIEYDSWESNRHCVTYYIYPQVDLSKSYKMVNSIKSEFLQGYTLNFYIPDLEKMGIREESINAEYVHEQNILEIIDPNNCVTYHYVDIFDDNTFDFGMGTFELTFDRYGRIDLFPCELECFEINETETDYDYEALLSINGKKVYGCLKNNPDTSTDCRYEGEIVFMSTTNPLCDESWYRTNFIYEKDGRIMWLNDFKGQKIRIEGDEIVFLTQYNQEESMYTSWIHNNRVEYQEIVEHDALSYAFTQMMDEFTTYHPYKEKVF